MGSDRTIVVSSACVVVFRARLDVAKGEPVTPENCEGMPAAVPGLSWLDVTAAGANGRVWVPSFGWDQLPAPMSCDDEDDP